MRLASSANRECTFDAAIHRNRASFNLHFNSLVAVSLVERQPSEPRTTLGASPVRWIISLSCTQREIACASNRPVHLWKGHSSKRAGCGGETDEGGGRDRREAAEDEEKWYGLTTHPTSMTAPWRMFVNYDSCPRGRKSYSWVGFRVPLWRFSQGRAARKGRVLVACHYDISNECLQHCETTLRRCRYNTVVLYPFLIRDWRDFFVIILVSQFLSRWKICVTISHLYFLLFK